MKKILLITLAFLALTLSAQAATLSFETDTTSFLQGDTIVVDLLVSGLETTDLTAFDIDVAFDDALLSFVDYTLYDGLGVIDFFEADDYSWGEYSDGVINLCEISYLWDDEFSFQSDSFVLATLTFTALEDGTTALSIDYEDLSVTASAVPLPSAVILMGCGLLGLTGVGRKKKTA